MWWLLGHLLPLAPMVQLWQVPPADTVERPVIHVSAKELQNSLVILMLLFERGAKAWRIGSRYELWDPSHVVKLFPN